MKWPDLSIDDRGDGRSRVHAMSVDARTVVHLTVQRDGGSYIARVSRVGMAHTSDSDGEGDTLEEAVCRAVRAAGCAVVTP